MNGVLKRLAAVAVATVIGFSAQDASASSVTFDFTGPRSTLGTSVNFAEPGISVLVESTGGQIHQNPNGLGVANGPDNNRLGSNGSTNETLAFTFTPDATLLSGIVFEHAGGTEQFDIFDENMALLGNFSISGPGGSSLVTLSSLDLFADTYIFRHTSGSGIRINSITVAPIPLPAGGLLLLSGIVGIAALRRRQKAAA